MKVNKKAFVYLFTYLRYFWEAKLHFAVPVQAADDGWSHLATHDVALLRTS